MSIVIHSPNRAIFAKPLHPRREHVSYVSAQVRRQVQTEAVGKTDEIHNLNIATRADAEASDTLKYFSERIPATFVFAGINVERAGLLSGARGEQIADRFCMVCTGPFACDEQWATLIAALETSLRLHRHRPGSLPELARYLHQRTGGMIGSLLWLIRSAAIRPSSTALEQSLGRPWIPSRSTSPPRPPARNLPGGNDRL
jgi:hypothetical protein